MLEQNDAADFIKAIEKESNHHSPCNRWEIIKRSTIAQGTKTIQVIWSFKCKCFTDGGLNKHKARLCAHGSM